MYRESRPLSWTIPVEGGWKVVAGEILHRVPCWGYVFEEPDTPGHIEMEKAEALGIPAGPLLREIKVREDR